jgi:8-oxo-dGTP diphosphatase
MVKLATLCYLRKDGKTLMIHRVKKENDIHEGKWNGVGGKLDPQETPEECAIREVKEETGLTIRNPLLKGLLTFPKFLNDEDWYVFVYLMEDFDGELIDSDEGNLKWIDTDKMLDLNLWEGDRVFLPLLDRSDFFSGKFLYVDGKLVEHSLIIHE